MPSESNIRTLAWAGVVIAVLAGMAACSIKLLDPPRALPATAPLTEFSACRAMCHDVAIAGKPHPAGSPANEEVAAYILKTLRGYGIATEFVTDTCVQGRFAGERNLVLGRIPGTSNTRAFALVAHYDSVPYGPGAADDGAGVAAMIEIARALRAGPPLRNDILVVFTDAEETGPIDGAGLFADLPSGKKTGIVLNLEARGSRGPALLFETSAHNGWLMREVAKARGVSPYTNSSMSEIYRRLPFGSDFDTLNRHGLPGFNVAFVDQFANYHTVNDQPATLSLDSLQHLGGYGLGLARHFGSIPLDQVTAPDATYFNLLGFQPLIVYPLSWHRPLSLFAATVFLFAVWFGLRRRHLTPIGCLAGAAGFLITGLVSIAGVEVLLVIILGPQQVLSLFTKRLDYLPNLNAIYQNNLYGAAFAVMVLAVFACCYATMAKHVSLQNLAAGALAWWLILLALLDICLPGGAYLAAWPLLCASFGLAMLFLTDPANPPTDATLAANTLCALPSVIFLAPAYHALLATTLIIAAPILTALMLILLAPLVPQFLLLSRPSRHWFPALAAMVAACMIMLGLATNGSTPARPKLNSVAYGLNHDTQKAFWMTADEAPDEWTSQFFKPDTPKASIREFMPGVGTHFKKAPAPIAPGLTGPVVQVLSDTVSGSTRVISLRITSPSTAARVLVRVVSANQIQEASVFGRPLAARDLESFSPADQWQIDINPFPRAAAEIVFKTDSLTPLAVNLIEVFYGQPKIPGIRPRPADMAAEPNTIKNGLELRGDHIFVTRTFHFPPPSP